MKPLEFSVGDYVLLKVSPWKGVVRFGKKGKLAPRFVGPFEIIEKIGLVAYRLDLLEELDGVQDTFHVSNLKKCLADPTVQVPLDEIQIDAKLNFVEEPVKILEKEFKKLKQSRTAIVKVMQIFAQSVASSVGPATISPFKTKSITTKPFNLLFWHDKWERRNTSTGSSENTPLTNHASTLANPDPKISPAFIQANYEVLESHLTEQRRQMRNQDLRTELEYYSEEYDEEREMEPRPAHIRKTTTILRTGSPRSRRQKVRIVELEDASNRVGIRVERESEGRRPSERRAKDNKNCRVNLPFLLVAHLGRNWNGQPLQSTLTSAYGGHQPSNNSRGNLHHNRMLLTCNAPLFIPNSIKASSVQIPTHVNP
nr:putative reverse transcriptase domain-containing protein [Tanacetum cinerariifolium]